MPAKTDISLPIKTNTKFYLSNHGLINTNYVPEMNKFDFDNEIDRRGSHSYKADKLKDIYGREDLIPLWVADMDFKADDHIVQALREIVNFGVYGYNIEPPAFKSSIQNWIKNIQNWEIDRDWITFIPGVVRGIGYILHYFTLPGDKIIIQPPVYHPFRLISEDNKRVVINNPLKINPQTATGDSAGAVYSMDLEGLKEIIREHDCKALILCNPHNPGGIRWSREQLTELADICYDNKILVISDEIHADLQLWDNKHTPFATISDKARDITITLGAPSKSFNVPGLASSYYIIPNPTLREGFYKWLTHNEYNSPSIMASTVTIAAYTKADPWRRAVIKYIEQNILYIENFCRKHLPTIKVIRPDASYLIWLDCRKLGLTASQLDDLFINRAHLALNNGKMFGSQGEGFMRLNVGSPRSIIEKAMNQLYNL